MTLTLTSALCLDVAAQPPMRRAATIEAVRTYAGFFHGQLVSLQGRVVTRALESTLTTDAASLRLVGRERLSEGASELRGVVYDIGRMNTDDPRLVTLELRDLIQREYGERWPKPGEEIVLQVTSAGPLPAPQSSAAPPIRHIVLDPLKYEGTKIVVVGQFRGRNLYADVPDSPTSSRDDFVLRSGDAALWVTGVRPRGKGFSFDPRRRVDTGQWVRVSGVVRQGRGLVWLEGTSIEIADATSEEVEEVAGPPLPPPPLDVVFTSPSEGEVDVRPDAVIRLQFSRDVDLASLKDRIRISYSPAESVQRGEAQPPPVTFGVNWTAPTRGLEIRPSQPLERFRQVRVELLDGIRGPDGAALRAFSLTFSTGGS
jgi:Bacterial Ig-like domain